MASNIVVEASSIGGLSTVEIPCRDGVTQKVLIISVISSETMSV